MRKILILVTLMFAFTTAVCGMWMYSQEVVENSSKVFHMSAAFGTLTTGTITMFLPKK